MFKRLVLFLLVLSRIGIAQAQTSLDTAVNFTVKDVDGITHQLYDYLDQGRIVLIDFFTVTCGPCATYASEINASYQHFGCNTGNVVVLGINWGADNAQVTDFGETYGATYPEVSGTEGNGNHVVADFGILSYPSAILIMPDKSIPETYIWPPSTQHLDSVISQYGGIESSCLTGFNESTDWGNEFMLSPNPATDHFYLPLPDGIFLTDMELFDLQGLLIRRFVTTQTGLLSNSRAYSLNGILPGYYVLRLKTNLQNRITKALIVH